MNEVRGDETSDLVADEAMNEVCGDETSSCRSFVADDDFEAERPFSRVHGLL